MQIRPNGKEMGARLFIARAPSRDATEAGEQWHQRARQILRDHDLQIDEIAELAGAGNGGRLRIGKRSAMVTLMSCQNFERKSGKPHAGAEISVAIRNQQAFSTPDSCRRIDSRLVSLHRWKRAAQHERKAEPGSTRRSRLAAATGCSKHRTIAL